MFDTENVKVSEGHKALASYIKKETGKGIKPETIATIDALREAYRKDPARVAEREAQKAAARQRKEEAYRKAVEKAAALAKSLGLPAIDVATLDEKAGDAFGLTDPEPEPEPSDDDFVEEEPDGGTPEAPEATTVEKPKPARKPRAKKQPDLKVVKTEPTPSDEPDTSAIVVAEAEDGWESDGTEADDDFFDDEAEDY